MRHEIVTALDAINGVCTNLLMLQSAIRDEQDIRALSTLMILSVEYIAQLNLMLLWTDEEINDRNFKVELTIDVVYSFVEDLEQLYLSISNNATHNGLSRSAV